MQYTNNTHVTNAGVYCLYTAWHVRQDKACLLPFSCLLTTHMRARPHRRLCIQPLYHTHSAVIVTELIILCIPCIQLKGGLSAPSSYQPKKIYLLQSECLLPHRGQLPICSQLPGIQVPEVQNTPALWVPGRVLLGRAPDAVLLKAPSPVGAAVFSKKSSLSSPIPAASNNSIKDSKPSFELEGNSGCGMGNTRADANPACESC